MITIMKKIMLAAMAIILCTLSSCTNDDIEISNDVTIKVNPSGVISPFTFEFSTGELASFNDACKLRIRLLAYNKDGNLAAADTAFVSNYAGIMNSNMTLSKGAYTLISITDVVVRSNDVNTREYWNLSDKENINNVKITSTGLISGKYGILGIASKNIMVDGSTSYDLNPKPAGALLCLEYDSIHHYSDVVNYQLQCNRNSDYVTFDSEGNSVSIPQNNNNEFDWRVSIIEPQISYWEKYTSALDYAFIFPVSNISFRFVCSTNETTDLQLYNDMTVSLKAGDEYGFVLNICDPTNNYLPKGYCGMLNGSSVSAMTLAKSTSVLNSFGAMANTDLRSAKLVDLIKK